jgi:ABC-type polysaccharide/polyol phosphate export permease
MRENKHLIRSISMPLEAIPFSVIAQFLLSHVFEFVFFLCVFIILYGFSWALLLYPLIFILYAAFVLGVSLIASTLGVFVEDLENVWAVCSRILWLATPIFYVVPTTGLLARLIQVNPLSHFISFARDIVIYHTFPNITALLGLLAISIITLAIGFFLFERYKWSFCDNV